MLFGQTVFWVDYFNNMKKCWEPLVEKIIANALYEEVAIEHNIYCIFF
jgi:hypothetical protein